jgi:hypothetical protein
MSVNSKPLVILALVTLVFGCVTQRPIGEAKVLQPISPTELSQIGKIGVFVDPDCVLQERLPKVVKGASEGAKAEIAQGDFAPREPVGLLLLPIVLPLAVGMAAGVGAIRAHSAEKVNETEQAIKYTLSEIDPINLLVRKIAMHGDNNLDAYFTTGSDFADENCLSDDFQDSVDYQIILRDIIMSLPVSGYDPGTRRYFSPDVSIVIHASLEVKDNADQSVLYSGIWLYKGARFDYLKIDENNDIFRKEIEFGIDAIANAVIRDAFLEPKQITVTSGGLTVIEEHQERTVERLDRLWK